MKTIIVDAGGTKLMFYTYEGDKLLLTEEIPGLGNIDLNKDVYKDILSYVEKQQEQVNLIIGMAGWLSISPEEKEEFINKIKCSKVLNISVYGDVQMHSLSKYKGQDIFVGALGTGSAFTFYDGKDFKTYGGYGHTISDIGSGYHFGLYIIKEYINAYEGGTNDYLCNLVNKHYNVTDPIGIANVIKGSEKQKISQITKVALNDSNLEQYISSFAVIVADEVKRLLDITKVNKMILTGSLVKSEIFKEKLLTYDFIEIDPKNDFSNLVKICEEKNG